MLKLRGGNGDDDVSQTGDVNDDGKDCGLLSTTNDQ